jgi:hypothetical protein
MACTVHQLELCNLRLEALTYQSVVEQRYDIFSPEVPP